MLIKIKKLKLLSTFGLLFIFLFIACMPIIQMQVAQAGTFEMHIPAFTLHCNDNDVIQSGTVKYDLTNAEEVANKKAIMQSDYQIAPVNRIVEFAIPFISSASNIPVLDVTANGQKIDGTVYYGNEFFTIDNDTNIDTLIDEIYSQEIDKNINGTLYTIIPNKDTISIELSFDEGKTNFFIYETSNSVTSSGSANKTTWTMSNALACSEYKFFILGENADHIFSCDSDYQTETVSGKDFVDCQYEYLKELYDEYGVTVGFIYSMFNKCFQNKQPIKYDMFFLDLISKQRFNIYKFSVFIDTNIVISYELPINIQRNFAFTPTIYLVEQKITGDYPIRHTIELNNEIPYIIETNVKTDNNGTIYNAESAEDFYFVFCSSKNPKSDMYPNNDNKNNNSNKYSTLFICCYVFGSIAFAVLIGMIGITIYKKVKHR